VFVSTAGFHVREDRPFVGGDTSYRIIPRRTNPANIIQSHTSIGFDRTETFRDINITYPVDRLEELVAQGEIGSLSDNYYSFMGALSDVSQLVGHFGPKLAENLKTEGVDVVLLVPT
jgi:D-proline reductase (dithiol) PrdB